MAYQIKRGDRRPYFRVQLLQTSPTDSRVLVPVSLVGATGVKFMMKTGTGQTLKVNSPGFIVDAINGIVEYRWGATDTDTSGTYNVEAEVDWAGEKQTFPSVGYFSVTISDDLG